MSVRSTIASYFHHFNAGELSKMSASLLKHIDSGGKIFITLAGAMSTAGIGQLLAPMIRQGHVAAISCTGANLEEDVFRMMAYPHYESIEDWRTLSLEDEEELLNKNMNRVTDVCIPEEQAIRDLESHLLQAWKLASDEKRGNFHITTSSMFCVRSLCLNRVRAIPHPLGFSQLAKKTYLSTCQVGKIRRWATSSLLVPLKEQSILIAFFLVLNT